MQWGWLQHILCHKGMTSWVGTRQMVKGWRRMGTWTDPSPCHATRRARDTLCREGPSSGGELRGSQWCFTMTMGEQVTQGCTMPDLTPGKSMLLQEVQFWQSPWPVMQTHPTLGLLPGGRVLKPRQPIGCRERMGRWKF